MTDEAFVKEFSDLFLRHWAAELALHGIKYEDREGSTMRMLARTVARTLHEWNSKTG